MPYPTHDGGHQLATAVGLPASFADAVAAMTATGRRIGGAAMPAPTSLPATDSPVSRWMSVDGSCLDVAVDMTAPDRTVGCVRVAVVTADIDDLNARDHAGLLPIGAIADRTDVTTVEAVVPLTGLHAAGQPSLIQSWQTAINDVFATTRIGSRTINEWIDRLLRTSSGQPAPMRRCPLWQTAAGHDDLHCPATGVVVADRPVGCPSCGRLLYPADRLGVVEPVAEHGRNLDALTVLMRTVEAVVTAATIMDAAETDPARLADTAVVLDGPVASFGRNGAIRALLHRAFTTAGTILTDAGLPPLAVVGIEKSGRLADHVAATRDRWPAGSITDLPDRHLSTILDIDSVAESLGSMAYLGRRVVHATRDDRRHVLTIVPADGWPYGLDAAAWPADYPAASRIVDAVERLGCAMYPDAVVPVVIAHDTCAFPAHMTRASAAA